MLKVLSVVGARPQFIKAAAVSRIIKKYVTEILIHPGQHYANNMSEVFLKSWIFRNLIIISGWGLGVMQSRQRTCWSNWREFI